MSNPETIRKFLEKDLSSETLISNRILAKNETLPREHCKGDAWILFRADRLRFALKSTCIESILPYERVAHIPFLHDKNLVGFFNFRGQGIPVYSKIGDVEKYKNEKLRLIIISNNTGMYSGIIATEIIGTNSSHSFTLGDDLKKNVIQYEQDLYVVLESDFYRGFE